MTNLDKIRSMTDEELINFLDKYVDPSEINPEYCEKECPYSNECLTWSTCKFSDRDLIKSWGMKEIREV